MQIYPFQNTLCLFCECSGAATGVRKTGIPSPAPTPLPGDVNTALLFPVVQGFTCINNTLNVSCFYKKLPFFVKMLPNISMKQTFLRSKCYFDKYISISSAQTEPYIV